MLDSRSWCLEYRHVPDVTNCPVVLCDSTQCVIDKCYNGFWMHAFCFVLIHRFNRCCISSNHVDAWSRVAGGTFVRISFCIVTSLTSGGSMSCFMMYQTIVLQCSSRVSCTPLPKDFGMTSRSSVRSTLSTALGASGVCFRSPRMYAGSRVALCAGELWSYWSCLALAKSRTWVN